MEKIKKYKKIFIIAGFVIFIICMIICFIIDNQKNNAIEQDFDNIFAKENINEVNNSENNSQKITVHIVGEINNPGVYELENGARVIDVINKAGGITGNASEKSVNLAYVVEDGQKIYIPNKLDEQNNISVVSSDIGNNIVQDNYVENKNIKININTATQSELESLTGIGPSIASKIILYRQSKGKFKSIEELKKVDGVGDSKFKNIKEEIYAK